MKKSYFDLTHERKLTMKPNGTLYPIMCERCLPGEHWKIDSQIFGRMIPLVNPIYHRFDLFVHAFFVPDRLVWDNFRQWIAPEFASETAVVPVYPSFKVVPTSAEISGNEVHYDAVQIGTLADHLGLQFNDFYEHFPFPGVTENTYSSLPFRAYQLIWNEHYRDVDIQEPLSISKSDGYTSIEEQQFKLLQKNWEKDYFTGAKHTAQKGDPVIVPSTREGYLKGFPNDQSVATQVWRETDGLLAGDLAFDGTTFSVVPSGEGISELTKVSVDGGLGFSINDLRWANAYQKFKEKLMRHGSRYNQYLRSMFGVKSSDARLDRPEYIGGGRQPWTISEVLQTSQSDQTPLGSYGGHGVTAGKSQMSYRVEEHGQIMVLCSIMPRSSYFNVLRKQLMITDVFDYPVPDFANLGMQEVFNWEVSGIPVSGSTNEKTVFGYQQRYAEYKMIPSTIHGLFRTDENLKRFHAARPISDTVVLDENFIQNTGLDATSRIFAFDESDYDPILLSVINRVSAVRPLPRLTIPKL